MGMLWIGRRRDSVYGWFLASAVSWTISSLSYYVQDHHMGFWDWQRLVFGGLDWFAIFGTLTVHRMLGIRRPRLERALLGVAALVPVVLWSLPVSSFQLVSGVLHAVALGLVVLSLASCARDLRRLPRTEIATLAFCLALCLVFGLHDYLVHFELVPLHRPFMLQFAGPVILLSFGAMLTTRFVREYRRAENLNAELEERVREKHGELEANFERMRELERAHVLALERARLMREVHDGIGGQLVSTLAMVESGPVPGHEVAEALRTALDEMRLVVQSLDPLVDDLPTLLGVVRVRLEPRLAAQGLRFEWAVRDLPPMPELGRDGFLHVLRIVQEAITNVVKHAKARVITVTTGLRDDAAGRRGVFLEVRDDGVGAARPGPGGRGFANMRQRADEIGAELVIRDAEPGTRVELWLPLTAQLSAAHLQPRTPRRASDSSCGRCCVGRPCARRSRAARRSRRLKPLEMNCSTSSSRCVSRFSPGCGAQVDAPGGRLQRRSRWRAIDGLIGEPPATSSSSERPTYSTVPSFNR
jgi:signal transduction histidine kinase